VEASLRRAINGAYEAQEAGEAVWCGAASMGETPLLAHVMPTVEVVEEEALEILETDIEPLAEGRPEEIEIAVGSEEEVVVHEVRAAGPRRILVVDDEPEIRLLLERALSNKGFSVDTAGDGEEALAKISGTLPDLVLLDAMLPKTHGFEVARRVRSDPKTKGVPVIIMTAVYRGWRFAQDARENYGAEDYVEKPFHLDDLHRRIEAVLESTATRKPTSPSTEANLKKGKELLLAGRIPEAVVVFEEAAGADPFSAEAHYQLAKALRAQGDHFRAMTAYERAAELRPSFFQALRSLAALYLEKGFRRKTAETLERALGAAPDAATRDTIRKDLLKLI
jgi:DNA-binding response OmpR family regulator